MVATNSRNQQVLDRFLNPVRDILSIKADYEGLMHFELSNANGQLLRSGDLNFSAGTKNVFNDSTASYFDTIPTRGMTLAAFNGMGLV